MDGLYASFMRDGTRNSPPAANRAKGSRWNSEGKLVGASGFEPPTPRSRTECSCDDFLSIQPCIRLNVRSIRTTSAITTLQPIALTHEANHGQDDTRDRRRDQ